MAKATVKLLLHQVNQFLGFSNRKANVLKLSFLIKQYAFSLYSRRKNSLKTNVLNDKSPCLAKQGLLAKEGGWRLPTLPLVTAVPLALRGLTSLFGKGRGEHPRYNHHYCAITIASK